MAKERKSVIIDVAKNGSTKDKLWLLSVTNPQYRVLIKGIITGKTIEEMENEAPTNNNQNQR